MIKPFTKKLIISLVLIVAMLIALGLTLYFVFPQTLGEGISATYGDSVELPSQTETMLTEAYQHNQISAQEIEYVFDQLSPDMVMNGIAELGNADIMRDDFIQYVIERIDLGTLSKTQFTTFFTTIFPADTFISQEELASYNITKPMVSVFLPIIKNKLLQYAGGAPADSNVTVAANPETTATPEVSGTPQVAASPETAVDKPQATVTPEAAPDSEPETTASPEISLQPSEAEAPLAYLPNDFTPEMVKELLNAPSNDELYEVVSQVLADDYTDYDEFVGYVESLSLEVEPEILAFAYNTLLAMEQEDGSLSLFANRVKEFPPAQQKQYIAMFRGMANQYLSSVTP